MTYQYRVRVRVRVRVSGKLLGQHMAHQYRSVDSNVNDTLRHLACLTYGQLTDQPKGDWSVAHTLWYDEPSVQASCRKFEFRRTVAKWQKCVAMCVMPLDHAMKFQFIDTSERMSDDEVCTILAADDATISQALTQIKVVNAGCCWFPAPHLVFRPVYDRVKKNRYVGPRRRLFTVVTSGKKDPKSLGTVFRTCEIVPGYKKKRVPIDIQYASQNGPQKISALTSKNIEAANRRSIVWQTSTHKKKKTRRVLRAFVWPTSGPVTNQFMRFFKSDPDSEDTWPTIKDLLLAVYKGKQYPRYVLQINMDKRNLLTTWPFTPHLSPHSCPKSHRTRPPFAVYVVRNYVEDQVTYNLGQEYITEGERGQSRMWIGPHFSSRDELTSMCEALFFSEAVPGDKLLGAAPLSDNSTTTGTTHSVTVNVEKRNQLLQQGYVIMQSGIPACDADWFQALEKDVKALFGSRHYVSLINTQGKKTSKRGMLLFEGEETYQGTRKKSKMPKKLQKVKTQVEEWLNQIPIVFEQLGLVNKQRSFQPGCLICAEEGCGAQDFHTDFCPRNVRDMVNKKEALSASLIGSLTPTGSQVLIKTLSKDTLVTKPIELKFGEFLLFRGDVVHAGAGYDSFNLRCFSLVEHKELCPYNTDHSFWEALEPNHNVRM